METPTLDPECARYIDAAGSLEADILSTFGGTAGGPDTRRLVYERLAALARRTFPAEIAVEDAVATLPGREIAIRLYRRREAAPSLPVLVYCHGGGWVVGSIASHDALCAEIANRAGVAVASVQYRRAPENPHPAPLDDVVAATEWLARHAAPLRLDAERLALGGDSAGAHLALLAALSRAAARPAIRFLLLFYPVIAPRFDTPSYAEHANPPGGPTRDAMRGYWAAYLGAATRLDDPPADASPDAADDARLRGLPSSYLVTAGFDGLRDEGEAFARRIEALGVDVTLRRAATLPHGFARMLQVSAAAGREVDTACDALRRALSA